MTIEYELTKDDLIALRLHHYDYFQKNIVERGFIVFFFTFFILSFFGMMGHLSLGMVLLVSFAIPLILAIFTSKKNSLQSENKRLKKNLDKLLGTTRLISINTFTGKDEGFAVKKMDVEMKLSWSCIEKIEETDEHFFIYIASRFLFAGVENAAFTVPKRAFLNQNSSLSSVDNIKQEFIQEEQDGVTQEEFKAMLRMKTELI